LVFAGLNAHANSVFYSLVVIVELLQAWAGSHKTEPLQIVTAGFYRHMSVLSSNQQR